MWFVVGACRGASFVGCCLMCWLFFFAGVRCRSWLYVDVRCWLLDVCRCVLAVACCLL